jgi:hypothetical protein
VTSTWVEFGGLVGLVGVVRQRRPLAVELELLGPWGMARILNGKFGSVCCQRNFRRNSHRKAWNDGGYVVKSFPPVTALAPA